MLANFHKKGLAIALTAALGGAGLMANSAHAVNLADDGIGEVLLYQYYTVRNDWQTFFHITNTSDQTVAAKVRFREAQNSRDVLNFVVVLSPYDVWTAFTALDAAGNPVLRTVDTSCTSPTFLPVAGGINPNLREAKFRNLAFTGALADGGDTTLDRAMEGHVEVISLGAAGPGGPVANAAKHGINGVPANCAVVANAFNSNNPAQLAATAAEFDEPINALKGNGYLIRVNSGQGGGFDPDVLANFYNPGEGQTGNSQQGGAPIGIDGTSSANLIPLLNNEQGPGDVWRNPGPSLNSAWPPVSVISDDTTGVGPRIIMDEWDRGVDAVSAVLTRSSIVNEWAARLGDGAFNNTTEWVVTFPTKNFYVDLGPAGQNTSAPFNNPTLVGTVQDDGALAPFQEDFVAFGESCMTAIAHIYDREERSQGGLSPFAPPLPLELCNETNVITFRGEVVPPVLGSEVAVNIATADLPEDLFVDGAFYGMMKLDLTFDSAGLGTDERANQVYDNETVLITVPEADMTAFCADFIPNNFPPGFSWDNPPPFGSSDSANVTGGSGDYLRSTVILAGINARPFVAQLTGTSTLVDRGQCDNPDTLGANEQRSAVFEEGVTDGWAIYDGLPVTGWMMSFRTLANQPELSYSAILQHGYERNVMIDEYCDAIFRRDQNIWEGRQLCGDNGPEVTP